MTTNIATTAQSDLVLAGDQTFWTDNQIAVLEQLGVANASPADLAVFFHQCTRTGLDPFAKQIYMIGRKDHGKIKQTIQTGIDGFRLIARRSVDRSGETLGYEDAQWCGRDGQWVDIWLAEDAPAAARVTVLRQGQRYPAVALFAEYAGRKYDGSLTSMWANKPALMLAKCAEALALRKAFPQDLSGLYTSDEMSQADTGAAARTQRQQPAPPPQASAAVTQRQKLDEAAAQSYVDTLVACENLDDLEAVWAVVRQTDPGEHLQTLIDAYQARGRYLTQQAPAEPQQGTLDDPADVEVEPEGAPA